MTNVVNLKTITTLDIPAERVLTEALEAELSTAIVIGYRKDGTEYFASSAADGSTVTWLMDRCKHELMKIADGEA